MKKCETTAWHVYNFITLRIKQTILIFDLICWFFSCFITYLVTSFQGSFVQTPHISIYSAAIVTPLTSLSLQISFPTPLVSCWLPVSWFSAVDFTVLFLFFTTSNFRKAKGCMLRIRWIGHSFFVFIAIHLIWIYHDSLICGSYSHISSGRSSWNENTYVCFHSWQLFQRADLFKQFCWWKRENANLGTLFTILTSEKVLLGQ